MNEFSETLEVSFAVKDPYNESYLSSGLILEPSLNNSMEFDNACFVIIDHNISVGTIKIKLVNTPYMASKMAKQQFSFNSLSKEDLEELSGEYAVTAALNPGNNEVLKSKQEEVFAMEEEYKISLNFLDMKVL